MFYKLSDLEKKFKWPQIILNSNKSRRRNYCSLHEKGTNSFIGFGGYCSRIAYLGTRGSLTTAVLNSAPATDPARAESSLTANTFSIHYSYN